MCLWTRLTRNVVGSDIDDDASLFQPLALDKLGLADGSDDDISVLQLRVHAQGRNETKQNKKINSTTTSRISQPAVCRRVRPRRRTIDSNPCVLE